VNAGNAGNAGNEGNAGNYNMLNEKYLKLKTNKKGIPLPDPLFTAKARRR
jgi:hypothetical protein